MRKVLASLLAVICLLLMCSLIACDVVDPVETMKAPAVIKQVHISNSELDVLSMAGKILPKDIKLLKITSLTEQKHDWLAIDLTGDKEPEFIFGYRDQDEKIGVIILEAEEQGFKKLYMKTFDNYDYQLGFDNVIAIKPTQLINNKLSQIVVSYNFYAVDHNSFSVNILGFDPQEKAVKNYFNLQDLPQAEIEVELDRIIISAMGISKEYKWNGQEFMGKQIYKIPEVNKNDVVVHYAMSKKGPMIVSKEEVTLNVGQRLLLIRDDELDLTERIMQGGDDPSFVDILDYTAEKVYTAQKAGLVHITIVPNGGFDWDNAKEIIVTVN